MDNHHRQSNQTVKQEDAGNPSDMAPSEVWSFIFDQLNDDPSSVAACYRTCKLWKSLLENQRANFLFHEVTPILSKYLDENTTKGNLLECRLVSKSWKFGVDNFLQGNNIEDKCSIEDRSVDRYWLEKNEWNFDHRCLYHFELQHLKDVDVDNVTDINIFSKSVKFHDYWEAEDDENDSFKLLKLVVNEFLPKFGIQIESCYFQFSGLYKPQVIKVVLLAALKSLPNLRVLSICYNMSTNRALYDTENYKRLGVLLNVEETERLPILEKLTTLNLLEIPPAMVQELTSLSDNIVQFNCKKYFSPPDLGVETGILKEYYRVDIPNLQKLERLSLPNWFMMELNSLENIEHAPLTSLLIYDPCSLEEMRNLACKYKATLKVLQLSPWDHTFPQTEEFDLPYLETLRIAYGGVHVHANLLDFILPLKSMKHLGVIIQQKMRNKPKPIIEFSRHYRRMYESNIWKLFPNLCNIFVKAEFRRWSYVSSMCGSPSEI